jgi:F-type H+-transporting ATPase subunit alpha
VEEQVVSVWAGTTGKLDDIAVEDVRPFESELLDTLRRDGKILQTIRETLKLDEDTENALSKAVDDVKFTFRGTGRDGMQAGQEDVNELEETEIDQARIVKNK